jgi:dihydropteroate synthase
MHRETKKPNASINVGGKEFQWGKRTYLMGIINTSPESFSGDGITNMDLAIQRGEKLLADGADILDIGGQSTRPPTTALKESGLFGSNPLPVRELSPDEEIARVIPVIASLSQTVSIPISIDSYKPEVVEMALKSGATIVNDVWGLKRNPEIARIAATHGAMLILMHNQDSTNYNSLLPDIIKSLQISITQAIKMGVERKRIVIDPGFGFGKTAAQNLELLRGLNTLQGLDQPILLGTSRKGTIGYILDLPTHERIEGTAATVAIGIANGADMIRVHDVREMKRVAKVTDAIIRYTPESLIHH